MSKSRRNSRRGFKTPGVSAKSKPHKPAWLKAQKRGLAYASYGWPVVPMHSVRGDQCTCQKRSACNRPGKHPATAHGVKDATTESDIIKSWWVQGKRLNIGIATGKRAGIIALDIDPRNRGYKTLKRLEAELGVLPKTTTSKTGGGGKHLIFAYPDVPIRKDSAGKSLGRGIDVLSDGAIMISPPSRHASGKRYRWASRASPAKIKPVELPANWLKRLTGEAVAKAESVTADVIPEGDRNNALTRLAGVLQRSGASPTAITAALLAENKVRCSPPLDDSEINEIVKSISRYSSPPEGDRADDAEKLVTVVLGQHFQKGKHLLYGSDGQFWNYGGKFWVPVQDEWIEGRIFESIKASPFRTTQQTTSLMSQVRRLLQAKLAAQEDKLGFLKEPASVINCANGEVWISGDGQFDLRPHRPESYLRYCLDVAYDPKAKCPQYNRALVEIFARAENPTQLRRHWNELVGYVIQPRRNIPIIPILLGAGDNGKTKLVQTIQKLLGPSQVYAQRVEELEKHRFAMGGLLGKLLYLDDDVKAGARLPDGILKTISEAKVVTGEIKYKQPFTFIVRTVPMLLCNNVPSLADLSHGMLRRLMVIPFDRTFTEKDKDEHLFDRIWSQDLPGVLNKALKGYARLLNRGHFKIPSAVRQATARWLEQANPLPAFIDQCCTKGPSQECWMRDLYAAYQGWAGRAGFTMIQNQLSFRRNLEHLGFKAKHGNRGQKVVGLAIKGVSDG